MSGNRADPRNRLELQRAIPATGGAAMRVQLRLGGNAPLPSLSTFADRSVSLRRNAANDSTIDPTDSAPTACSRLLNAAYLAARMTAALIHPATWDGVASGACNPYQPRSSNPGSVSRTGGSPAASGVGFAQVTARARTRPVFMIRVLKPLRRDA